MSLTSTTPPFRSASATPPHRGLDTSSADGARRGIVWIAAGIGAVTVNVIDAIRALLGPSRIVETLTPAHASAWIEAESGARRDVAIVVADAAARGARAAHRAQAHEAGLAFTEILVTSDWDGLVERTDSTLFEQLAAFFAGGPAPASHRAVTRPDAVVQIDWHAPHQIRKRLPKR